jgi:hypothetical protein
MEKDPRRAASVTLADVAAKKHETLLAQSEAKYQALQQLVMEQMGIKESDLTTELPVPFTPAAPAPPAAAGDKTPGAAASVGGGAGAAGPAPASSKAAAAKPFAPSATQQQQGKKK